MFLVGVRKGERFVTITKIGTGVSDELWKELHTELHAIKVADKPKEYEEVNKLFTPDVWVAPKIVVEIAGDDLTRSSITEQVLLYGFRGWYAYGAINHPVRQQQWERYNQCLMLKNSLRLMHVMTLPYNARLMVKPRFSIIIPTLNEEKFLPKLLASLARQTVKNFDVVVVDGTFRG